MDRCEDCLKDLKSIFNRVTTDCRNSDYCEIKKFIGSLLKELPKSELDGGNTVVSRIVPGETYNSSPVGTMGFLVRKDTAVDTIVSTITRLFSPTDFDDEIVIVDPYFYWPAKKENDKCKDILGKLFCGWSSIKEVKIVTSPYPTVVSDENLSKKDLENNKRARKNWNDQIEVKNSYEEIFNKYGKQLIDILRTWEFHDRYWIFPKSNNGIIVGTSLNGIGSRICVITKLESDDVQEILQEVHQIKRNSVAGRKVV